MTDVHTVSAAAEPPPDPGSSGRKPLVGVIALVVALGLGALVVLWVRRGGPRRAITELVEDSAVKLADALLDEVLPAA
jgi:uncharacterized protein HemX